MGDSIIAAVPELNLARTGEVHDVHGVDVTMMLDIVLMFTARLMMMTMIYDDHAGDVTSPGVLDYWAAIEAEKTIFNWQKGLGLDEGTRQLLKALCDSRAFKYIDSNVGHYLSNGLWHLCKNYPEWECFRSVGFDGPFITIARLIRLGCRDVCFWSKCLIGAAHTVGVGMYEQKQAELSWTFQDGNQMYQVITFGECPVRPCGMVVVVRAVTPSGGVGWGARDVRALHRRRGPLSVPGCGGPLHGPGRVRQDRGAQRGRPAAPRPPPRLRRAGTSSPSPSPHHLTASPTPFCVWGVRLQLGQADAELLLSALTVPYMRVPLVAAFFATEDRINALRSADRAYPQSGSAASCEALPCSVCEQVADFAGPARLGHVRAWQVSGQGKGSCTRGRKAVRTCNHCRQP
jgi:hypothetical protein